MGKQQMSNLEVEKVEVKPNMVAGLDIDKIVKLARDSYAKNEKGLAKRLSTGSNIVRAKDDKDFVVWTAGDFWQSLTGLRGLPFGRIVQISGKPDSGKSSTSMSFMKFAQDQEVLVILWDSERKFSAKRFSEKMGGQPENLLVVDTNKIIDGVKAVAQFVHAAKELNPNVKILICWDSIGASLNSQEDKEESEDFSQQPGVSAKENSYAIKKLNKLANRYVNKETGEESIAILVVNQTYTSIGFGPASQIEKGGSEVYYLSSVLVQLSRIKDLNRVKGGKKYKYGIVSRAKVKKNHLFEADECISELDVVVSASGISLADEAKKKETDVEGWDSEEDGDE